MCYWYYTRKFTNGTNGKRSIWKCYKRIDLMVKKQRILLLQNHLKDVYKNECVELNNNYEYINIDFSINRSKFNQIKNKEKKKNKRDKFKKKKKIIIEIGNIGKKK
eukprot:331721_1